MSDGQKHVPPPPSASMDDAAHAVAKGVIGAVPVAGAGLAEMFALIVAPPLEKRRDQWLKAVARAVNELHASKGVSVEDLQNNERFVSLVLNATQVALRNHHKTKLEYLRNAIVSGHGLNGAVSDDEAHVFVRLIDDLSPNQLRFAANVKAYGALAGHVGAIIFPNDSDDVNWLAVPLEQELISRGLYSRPEGEPTAPYRLTEFGYRFMIFIRGRESVEDREWMKKRRQLESKK